MANKKPPTMTEEEWDYNLKQKHKGKLKVLIFNLDIFNHLMYSAIGLSLAMYLSTSPLIFFFIMLSSISLWPFIILPLLDRILFHRCRCIFILSSNSSFVTLSVHGILSIFLRHKILKHFSLFFQLS